MKAILRAQEDLMSQGGSKGVSTVPQAVETLTAIMNDQDARDADRIAASKALMNGAEAYSQRKVLERQLRDMEALLRELTGGPVPVDTDTLNEYEDSPIIYDDLDPLLPSAAVPEEAV